MKFKKLIIYIIVSLSFLNLGGMQVYAQSLSIIRDENNLKEIDINSFLGMNDLKYNEMDFMVKNNFNNRKDMIPNNISLIQNRTQAINDENTTPNNAYTINSGTDFFGTITSESTQRWYTFTVTGSAIITADLYMESNADFDLYIFELDSENASLSLVGGSETASLGTSEIVKTSVETGTYFLLVNAYEGTGEYSTCLYLGTNDDKEINDTIDTASSYVHNKRMVATIDSPYDYDIYKFTITTNEIVDYTFERPVGYDYQILLYDGNSFYSIPDSASYRLESGVYYFVVLSNLNSGLYSNVSNYGLKILSYKMSSNSAASYMWYTSDMKAIFQFNADRTVYYINGYPINFSYSRSYTGRDGRKAYINLYKKSDQFVALLQEETYYVGELPDFINYKGPFAGDKSYSNALLLSLGNTNLVVNSFSSYYESINSSRAMIVIDSNTGEIIDIMEPNPIYDGVYVSWSRIRGTQCNYDYDPIE